MNSSEYSYNKFHFVFTTKIIAWWVILHFVKESGKFGLVSFSVSIDFLM